MTLRSTCNKTQGNIVAMVYGVYGGDELTAEQRQHLEDLINEELAMMDLPTEWD